MRLLRRVKPFITAGDLFSDSRRFAGAAESLLALHLDHEKEGVPSGAGREGIKAFNLDQMRQLLRDMREPQRGLKVVHIAGTKGKGSTATMLSSILHQSGLKVGTYTSPHVSTIHERIAINGRQIEAQAFDDLAERWKPVILRAGEQGPASLTHFEVLTALMMAHFAEQQVEIAVIEAGLGGITDATNVFAAQQLFLAVITALGLEHQAALGASLKEIAAAKAGICKEDRPILLSWQPTEEATTFLREKATCYGSPCSLASEMVKVKAGAISSNDSTVVQDFSIQPVSSDDEDLLAVGLESRLIGSHQARNAETAVAAAAMLKAQGFSQISKAGIRAGLESATLLGRFQVSKLGPKEPWLVLDGAHTPAAAAALVETLGEAFPKLPVAFIVAMADDKDHAGVLAALRSAKPHVMTFTTVPIAGSSARSTPPGRLVGHWQAASFDEDIPLRCRELMLTNMASAMEASQRELGFASGNAVICVTGSMHIVTAALNLEG